MSRPPSDRSSDRTEDAGGPIGYRPDDYEDSGGAGATGLAPAEPPPAAGAAVRQTAQNPRLGPVGWARFVWRQLTSMRTALVLLLLLGLAAVPGSIVPQNSADPNGVIQYKAQNPEAFKILNALQVFDTYTSFWFSAIYLLLFVSLIGCIIPRTLHHLRALRAAPPVTPARLGRLPGHRTETTAADPERALEAGRAVLRRSGYRVVRYDQAGRITLSAERGYLRETGNLVFHVALVGLLVSVGIGGGFIYTGQKIIIQGQTFTNSTIAYDSFVPGRWVTDASLTPYAIRLDRFDARYTVDLTGGAEKVNAGDYVAHVTTRERGGASEKATIEVNSPLNIGGTQVYLQGNGYAPVVSILDPSGKVVDESTTPFLATDAALTSLGVIKVPDGLSRQIALRGFFYPNPVQGTQGKASIYPVAGKSTELTLEVWAGDLGLDSGQPQNAYSLDTTHLRKLAGVDASAKALELKRGDTVALPDGLGSVRFDGWKRYIGIDVHHDPTAPFVGTFVVLAVAGLLTSLFVPRRRAWIAASAIPDGGTSLEYAGLARGDDPRLDDAVASIAWQQLDRLGERPEWTVGGSGRTDGWRT